MPRHPDEMEQHNEHEHMAHKYCNSQIFFTTKNIADEMLKLPRYLRMENNLSTILYYFITKSLGSYSYRGRPVRARVVL